MSGTACGSGRAWIIGTGLAAHGEVIVIEAAGWRNGFNQIISQLPAEPSSSNLPQDDSKNAATPGLEQKAANSVPTIGCDASVALGTSCGSKTERDGIGPLQVEQVQDALRVAAAAASLAIAEADGLAGVVVVGTVGTSSVAVSTAGGRSSKVDLTLFARQTFLVGSRN